MADDYVIDTNIWVEINKTLADIETGTELDCVETCRKWLQAFMAMIAS